MKHCFGKYFTFPALGCWAGLTFQSCEAELPAHRDEKGLQLWHHGAEGADQPLEHQHIWVHALPCQRIWVHAPTCRRIWVHALPCRRIWVHALICRRIWVHVLSCLSIWVHALPCPRHALALLCV